MLIYDLTFQELEDALLNNGFKKFRASQIWDWLYKSQVSSFSEMKNLPKDVLNFLISTYTITRFSVVDIKKASDGTTKILYQLSDNNLIETVMMPQHYGNSLCVTTQVGCNMGCQFCASGMLKKKRDLTSGEIILQYIQTKEVLKLDIGYVVVMGIGEPFDNYDNLLRFLTVINDPKGIQLGARHITVSTCGLVDKIEKYSDFPLQINLAISLHAPNNKIRNEIMPINKRYPIEVLIDSIKKYIEKTNRRVTIEYLLIQGINDKIEDAIELCKLLKGLNVYVNLIPYNEVTELQYKRPNLDTQLQFYNVLKQHKIQVTLRKEMGSEIDAACGQLRAKREVNN